MLCVFSNICFTKYYTNTIDPLTPHNVPKDPMMLALSPTKIADITYVVSRQVPQQVPQQESENDVILMVTKPYLAWVKLVLLPRNIKMS